MQSGVVKVWIPIRMKVESSRRHVKGEKKGKDLTTGHREGKSGISLRMVKY